MKTTLQPIGGPFVDPCRPTGGGPVASAVSFQVTGRQARSNIVEQNIVSRLFFLLYFIVAPFCCFSVGICCWNRGCQGRGTTATMGSPSLCARGVYHPPTDEIRHGKVRNCNDCKYQYHYSHASTFRNTFCSDGVD